MKKQVALSLLLIGSVSTFPVSANWLDKLKSAAEDEQLQQTVIDSALGSDSSASGNGLDTNTLINGLKEALEVGSKRAIDTISQPGGYLDNLDIRIPLPDGINNVASLLKNYGLESQVNQFEQSMNRAAEQAAPHATDLIVGALKEMTIEDAKKIYSGPDDAATQYFKDKTSEKLKALFQPSVKESLNEVGATRYYGELASQAKNVPFVGDKVNVDLDSYVTNEALNGLFYVLAAEEKKIRENPAARTTELLKEVFSQ